MDARSAFPHKLTSLQSRPRDACARRLLDQRYEHLLRPLYNLPRHTELDRQTSWDVGVATIVEADRCTFFRAHITNTRTRIFARVLRLFVKIDVTNLHARTLTSHAVLVNRIPRARWLFSQMALLDLRTSPPSGIGRHAGGWDVECHTPEGFGGRRVRRSEIVRPTWPMRPRCLLGMRTVTIGS